MVWFLSQVFEKRSKPKKTEEQFKTEERIRKLLQENTAKLTAREIIQMIKEYPFDGTSYLVKRIERKYKL